MAILGLKQILDLEQEVVCIKARRNKVNSSKYAKYMPTFERKHRKHDIINNTISVANADQLQAFPIGILLIHDAKGKLFTCTTSVINTNNKNIGLTAAH
ncbi:hypothetical protein Glove_79g86 [Diversispora epigaea]|uniref:Uncharacterized protein n=1 Tax=Diversispora epigaea TaxID=1348612 RepID=A0A397JCS0_9GLOM|nr:hypothetical protein Glove_79g86 [Diversispora epigaea]